MSQSPPTLTYETGRPPRQRMPAWVWTVVIVYLLLLVAFVASPAVLWYLNRNDSDTFAITTFVSVVVTVLMLAGLALLLTPVRLTRQGRMSRESFLIPLIASGLLVGLLIGGFGWALSELAWGSEGNDTFPWFLLAGGVVWIAWSVVFWAVTASIEPLSISVRLHRWLLAGSVAELLVAVPCHIVVRRRTECCAGLYTGTAICVGAVVMFIAFGPSVLLLYLRRSRQIAIPKI
jgi:hypothetical protein